MGILQKTLTYMMRSVCGVQFKDSKRAKDLKLMLGLNETIDQLAMAYNVN